MASVSKFGLAVVDRASTQTGSAPDAGACVRTALRGTYERFADKPRQLQVYTTVSPVSRVGAESSESKIALTEAGVCHRKGSASAVPSRSRWTRGSPHCGPGRVASCHRLPDGARYVNCCRVELSGAGIERQRGAAVSELAAKLQVIIDATRPRDRLPARHWHDDRHTSVAPSG